MYLNDLPKKLLKSLAVVTLMVAEKELKKLILYLWLEFSILIHINPIVKEYEIEITHKDKDVLKKKIKNLSDLKNIIDKQIKSNVIKKKEIDKDDRKRQKDRNDNRKKEGRDKGDSWEI